MTAVGGVTDATVGGITEAAGGGVTDKTGAAADLMVTGALGIGRGRLAEKRLSHCFMLMRTGKPCLLK